MDRIAFFVFSVQDKNLNLPLLNDFSGLAVQAVQWTLLKNSFLASAFEMVSERIPRACQGVKRANMIKKTKTSLHKLPRGLPQGRSMKTPAGLIIIRRAMILSISGCCPNQFRQQPDINTFMPQIQLDLADAGCSGFTFFQKTSAVLISDKKVGFRCAQPNLVSTYTKCFSFASSHSRFFQLCS